MSAILTEETRLRDQIASVGKSLFDRGLTFGSTGNISAHLSNGDLLMTPTNASLGSLDPARLSRFNAEGVHVDGDKPTKEAFLHQCIYCRREYAGAVVHLHSTHSVAVSILEDVDTDDVLPPLTPYYVMRVARCRWRPISRPATRRLPRRWRKRRAEAMRSFWLITDRSLPVRSCSRLNMQRRNWRKPPSSSCCSMDAE